MIEEGMMWTIFIILVAFLLVLYLGVLNRKKEDICMKKACALSAFWISTGILFGILVLMAFGTHSAIEYYTVYAVELTLSVDNLFVFIIIFAYFKVPSEYQHKALFYGIVGALLFRFLFILVGAELLDRFEFMLYVFGAILIFTAVKTVTKKENKGEGSFDRNIVVRGCRRIMKVTDEYDGDRFFTVKNGVRMATPLFLTVLVLEATDIVFAFDSVPAALAISHDRFIVFSSIAFAVLGLRSIYFALRGAVSSLAYLKYGLGVILTFIGLKMMLSHTYHPMNPFYDMNPLYSLVFIIVTLTVTVVLSVIISKRKKSIDGHDD